MKPYPTKFLIDGIDRLGKSSLIKNIIDDLGYHLVVHYDKPQVLTALCDKADMIQSCQFSDTDYDESFKTLSLENLARRLYQEEANRGMFQLIKSNVPVIFDRTHLGELVYAPMYRGYPGDYVFDMEREMLSEKFYTADDDIRLILLTSSNLDMLEDDGLSFDPTKKGDEQRKFIEAFNRSQIKNKVIVDVHNGQGGYKTFEEVYCEAVLGYKK
jgi:thymidylate kinase